MRYPIEQLAKSEFPELLSEIPDPPETLYVRGTLPHPSDGVFFLSVVGSRNYTPYGKDAVEHLLEGLRGYAIVIVSGLALGIDALAHKAALRAGLPTIAIPGSGLHDSVLYPATNRPLALTILESGGALLSEFEPEFRATAWSFPQRNRLMAGIAHATLIIEATERSGTLITARLASDYNRDVLAVPGSIFSKSSYGSHALIRLGAVPVTESADILDVFGIHAEEKEEQYDLSEDEQKVMTFLEYPRERDELIRALELPVSSANVLLASMELKGLIKETLGEIRRA